MVKMIMHGCCGAMGHVITGLAAEDAYAGISEETEAYHTYLENRILNKNELYILNQNIKTSEAIQEIVWKNKLVNAKAFMKT